MALNGLKYSAGLLSALNDLVALLEPGVAQGHSFEFPSQGAARAAEVAMYEWKTAGNEGLPPTLSKADVRAGIYDLARPAAQLRAYSQVVRVALVEHAKLAANKLAEGKLLTGLVALRGLIERIGALADNERRISNQLGSGDITLQEVLDASETIMKAIYGIRIDWVALAAAELRSFDPKDLPYKARPLTADMTARNVLTGVDLLEKRAPGTRVAYEVLCEFLHPNIGDLVSSSLASDSSHDHWGTRHMRRTIGLGAADLSRQFDLARVLDGVFEITTELVGLVPDLLSKLDELISTASKATKKAQHSTIRRNRDLFLRADPCPCLSGKTIRACAPMALKS